MASPLDLSAVINILMQILPFIVILAILPLVIRLLTGLAKI
jgi:hypothetical protein